MIVKVIAIMIMIIIVVTIIIIETTLSSEYFLLHFVQLPSYNISEFAIGEWL